MPRSRKPADPPPASTREQDFFDEIGNESFPASDPPAWPAMHLGAPRVEDAPKPAPRRRGRASGRRPAGRG